MHNNLVSIIMPCFNSENFIGQSIESVLNQTYQSWELLICDDDSDDNSKKIIKVYEQKDSRIKLVENRFNKGAPGARNSCLEAAIGQFIAFLDADDIWYSEKLIQQIDFMISNKYPFSFSYFDVIDEKGVFSHHVLAPKIVDNKNMLLSNFIPCLTAVYDVKVLGKIYQPDIKKRNDYALWLKILHSEINNKAYCLEAVTAAYRCHHYGLSSGSKFELLSYYWKCLRDFASVKRIQIVFLFLPYLLLIFVKKSCPELYNKLVTKF